MYYRTYLLQRYKPRILTAESANSYRELLQLWLRVRVFLRVPYLLLSDLFLSDLIPLIIIPISIGPISIGPIIIGPIIIGPHSPK